MNEGAIFVQIYIENDKEVFFHNSNMSFGFSSLPNIYIYPKHRRSMLFGSYQKFRHIPKES